MTKKLLSLMCMSVVYFTYPIYGEELSDSSPMRVGIRHIESGGVGYDNGYTTLEMFLSMPQESGSVVPFLDLRGHVFDDGKFAANTGLGIRSLVGCRIYGINAYYDYRNTKHQHYNQIALGLETLGVRWDFRINGYLPIGDKKSLPYDPTSSIDTEFDSFQGHYALIKQTKTKSSKIEYAMKGFNSEMAFHFLKKKNFDLYAAAGPYYYNYKDKQAIGGQVRIGTKIYQYLSFELINSYDSRFHENFQGQVGLSIPFGSKEKVRKNKKLKDCNHLTVLSQRLMQDVKRQEIVVVDTDRKTKVTETITTAINPETNLPYYFVFVDNTSNSAGTFESPYPTLTLAEENSSAGDFIYVFPGDGTSTGMNAGIALQNSQGLLGAATPHLLPSTLGEVVIPAMAENLPIITNIATDSSVVTLGNDNVVSGFYIENTEGVGIFGSEIEGFISTENKIVGGANGQGIFLSNVLGQTYISNTQFYQTDQIIGDNAAVHIAQTSHSSTISFQDNTFYGALVYDQESSVYGIYADLSTGVGQISALNIEGSTFSSHTSAVYANLTTGSILDEMNVKDSVFGSNVNGVDVNLSGGTFNTLNIASSTFNKSSYGINVNISSGSINACNLEGNTFTNNYNVGFNVNMSGGEFALFSAKTNSFYQNVQGISASLSDGVFSLLNVTSNTFNNNSQGINLLLSGGILLSEDPSYPILSLLDVETNTFTGNDQGINVSISTTGLIETLQVNESVFDENISGVAIDILGGTFDLFEVTNSTFNENAYAIVSTVDGGTFNTWNLSDSLFSQNGVSSDIGSVVCDFSSAVAEVFCDITNNQFSYDSDYSIGVLTPDVLGNFLRLSNNTFINTYGYSAILQTTGGSTCLDFVDNTATSDIVSMVGSYLWVNGGGLNTTLDSTQVNNVGTIDGYITPSGCP